MTRWMFNQHLCRHRNDADIFELGCICVMAFVGLAQTAALSTNFLIELLENRKKG